MGDLMKKMYLVVILILTVACDAPQKVRTTYTTTPSSSGTSGNGTDNATDGSNGGGTTDGGTTTPTTPDPTTEAGFENCNINYQFYGGSQIGYFGVCKNSTTETKFKLKMKSTDSTVGTCFVPINIQSNGNSFKLGIAECVHNEADKVYSMTLTKERSETINGIMVLKANALNSYMGCMSAKVDFMKAYPGCEYDYSCMQAAANYANQICTSFVQNYANLYKQISI